MQSFLPTQQADFPQPNSLLADDIFGREDRTPWGVLWLAIAWAVVEGGPGMALMAEDLRNDDPTGDFLVGAAGFASALACSALWVWFAVAGSMSGRRQWTIVVIAAIFLTCVRLAADLWIQMLTALLAWQIVGTAAVAMTMRYGIGATPASTHRDGRLTIAALMRYTVAAAALAWFTRSLGITGVIPLSALQIVAIGLAIGLAVGSISMVVLFALASPWRWLALALLTAGIAPLAAIATFYLMNRYANEQILVGAVFSVTMSTIIHLILFALPLATARQPITMLRSRRPSHTEAPRGSN
jgi:MFS family permease